MNADAAMPMKRVRHRVAVDRIPVSTKAIGVIVFIGVPSFVASLATAP